MLDKRSFLTAALGGVLSAGTATAQTAPARRASPNRRPTQAVLEPIRLQALRDRARREVDVGLEYGGSEGCSLALGYGDEVVFAEGYGLAKADTPMMIMSVTKTVLSAALWKLDTEGRLKTGDLVTKYLPGFGANGKQDITLEMLETHTAGLANTRGLAFPLYAERANRLADYATWTPEHKPGTWYEYHGVSAHWVLADVIEAIVGRDYRAYLKEEVLRPLGVAGIHGVSIGEPVSEQAKTLKILNCMNGWCPNREANKRPAGSEAEGLAVGYPGAGGVGTSVGIARLYQHYLHNKVGLWSPAVLDDARDHVRMTMPDPTGKPIRRTRTFQKATDLPTRYGERMFFGSTVSSRTFGHQGNGGQIAWADPSTGLSFGFLTNTQVFAPGGMYYPRSRELSTLAAAAFNRA